MSNEQHLDFNLQLVKDLMNEWSTAAAKYERDAEIAYSKLRSYLSLYQFRLQDDQKCNIREMLSQSLDELEKQNFIDDMDNYLDGFCFKLDKSVLPKLGRPKPTAVKIKIAPEVTQPMPPVQLQPLPDPDQQTLDTFAPVNFTENAIDYNDLDFYQMQFFQ